MVADAALVRAARLVVLHAVGLEALGLAGHELVDLAVLEAQVAAADEDVGAEQRLAVQDDLAVGEPLQAVGVAHRGGGEVAEPLRAPPAATGTRRSFSLVVT